MTQQSNTRYRSGLIVSSEMAQSISDELNRMMELIPARFALVSDVTGQIVDRKGDFVETNLLAISSLVVGDLAASQEIARLTGEYNNQQVVLREGKQARTMIAEAGENLVVFVQVSNEVPLGWGRMCVIKLASKLKGIAEEAEGVETDQEVKEAAAELDLGEGDISSLFENALDDLWTD